MCLSYYEYSYLVFLQEMLNNLEEKLSVICDERIGFEGLLAIAGLEFPGDSKLFELHKKYVEIFKHPVSLNGTDLGDENDDNGADNGNDKTLSGTDP